MRYERKDDVGFDRWYGRIGTTGPVRRKETQWKGLVGSRTRRDREPEDVVDTKYST